MVCDACSPAVLKGRIPTIRCPEIIPDKNYRLTHLLPLSLALAIPSVRITFPDNEALLRAARFRVK